MGIASPRDVVVATTHAVSQRTDEARLLPLLRQALQGLVAQLGCDGTHGCRVLGTA